MLQCYFSDDGNISVVVLYELITGPVDASNSPLTSGHCVICKSLETVTNHLERWEERERGFHLQTYLSDFGHKMATCIPMLSPIA